MDDKSKERELVQRVLAGDTRAFAFIVKNTERLIVQIIFKMISNKEDRKDLVQDVYLKAYSGLSDFRFESKLSTWIGTIAFNTCRNHLEKKKLLTREWIEDDADIKSENQEPDLSTAQSIEKMLHDKQLQEIILRSMEELHPVQRTVIALYHQQELSYEEIALIMSMPVGTIKSHLFRGRKVLKGIMLNKYKKEEIWN